MASRKRDWEGLWMPDGGYEARSSGGAARKAPEVDRRPLPASIRRHDVDAGR